MPRWNEMRSRLVFAPEVPAREIDRFKLRFHGLQDGGADLDVGVQAAQGGCCGPPNCIHGSHKRYCTRGCSRHSNPPPASYSVRGADSRFTRAKHIYARPVDRWGRDSQIKTGDPSGSLTRTRPSLASRSLLSGSPFKTKERRLRLWIARSLSSNTGQNVGDRSDEECRL